MNLKVYSHFHKEFPVNRNSSWLVPTFAASDEAYSHLGVPSYCTNVTSYGGGINKFWWLYSAKTDKDSFNLLAQFKILVSLKHNISIINLIIYFIRLFIN